jgi:acetolactate synthase I/III small subunit
MKQEYTFTLYTENHAGLINKIAIIFSRRKIKIESFNSSPSELEGIYRYTLVVTEVAEVVKKLQRQLEKLIDILKVDVNTNDEIIWQEMALYKVPTEAVAEKMKVERMLRQYGARVVVIRNDYIVFETTGQREEIENLVQALRSYGLTEFVRTARIAIIKGSEGFHNKIHDFEEKSPSEEFRDNEFLGQNQQIFSM